MAGELFSQHGEVPCASSATERGPEPEVARAVVRRPTARHHGSGGSLTTSSPRDLGESGCDLGRNGRAREDRAVTTSNCSRSRGPVGCRLGPVFEQPRPGPAAPSRSSASRRRCGSPGAALDENSSGKRASSSPGPTREPAATSPNRRTSPAAAPMLARPPRRSRGRGPDVARPGPGPRNPVDCGPPRGSPSAAASTELTRAGSPPAGAALRPRRWSRRPRSRPPRRGQPCGRRPTWARASGLRPLR